MQHDQKKHRRKYRDNDNVSDSGSKASSQRSRGSRGSKNSKSSKNSKDQSQADSRRSFGRASRHSVETGGYSLLDSSVDPNMKDRWGGTALVDDHVPRDRTITEPLETSGGHGRGVSSRVGRYRK